MRKLIYTLLTLILIAIAIFFAYQTYHDSTKDKHLKQKITATPVTTVTLKRHSIAQQINGIGKVEALQNVTISSKQAGYIASIGFQDGDVVKQGSLLFRLQDNDLKTQLDSDQALLTTKRNLYQRYQKAKREGLVASVDLSSAKADYETALNNVAQDKINLENTFLYAPITGKVSAHTVNVGDYISAGQTLTTIVNLQDLQIIYTVPASFAQQLQTGQAVKISTHTKKSIFLSGEVSYVAPDIDTDSGTITLHAVVKADAMHLNPGEFVTVAQTIGQQQVITVPETAIKVDMNGTSVFLVKHGKTEQVSVVRGANHYGQVVIKKGLKQGDIVVRKGVQLLHDGETVQIKN